MPPKLPNLTPEAVTPDAESLEARVHELEELCAELYTAGVEVSLPQPFLNRLWEVAAKGEHPHTFEVDLTKTPVGGHEPQIPDIALVHRPGLHPDRIAAQSLADLKPLDERRTVMVVEDDSAMLELLLHILGRENYELFAADSAASALEELERRRVALDLLITDFAMPGWSGRVLADQLRQRYPNLKVLYETGFVDMLFRDRVELEPNAAFLEKPFTARGLLEAARLVLFGTLHPNTPSAERVSRFARRRSG